MFIKFIITNFQSLKLTGGGSDLYLITKPEVTRITSLATIIPVKTTGIKSA